MREPTAGNNLPHATYSWANGDQAVASLAGFTPAAITVAGAVVGNGVVVVSPRAALPIVFGGTAKPSISAWISAANQVTLTISNEASAALVATGTAITLDIMVLPIIP